MAASLEWALSSVSWLLGCLVQGIYNRTPFMGTMLAQSSLGLSLRRLRSISNGLMGAALGLIIHQMRVKILDSRPEHAAVRSTTTQCDTFRALHLARAEVEQKYRLYRLMCHYPKNCPIQAEASCALASSSRLMCVLSGGHVAPLCRAQWERNALSGQSCNNSTTTTILELELPGCNNDCSPSIVLLLLLCLVSHCSQNGHHWRYSKG